MCESKEIPEDAWAQAPPLHRAARVGDLAQVRALIAEGANLEEQFVLPGADWLSRIAVTPILIAAGSGDGAGVETVRILLEMGADPRPPSPWGSAAIVAAGCWGGGFLNHGDAERLRALLDAGSDPNERAPICGSLLERAAEQGDPARVSLLLEQGARIDLSPRALLRATQSGSAECVRLLLAAGADPAAVDRQGRTPIAGATSAGAAEVLLAAGAARGDPIETLKGILELQQDSIGLEEGSIAAARALIATGIDLDRADAEGWTLLERAAKYHNADAVRVLIESGASIAPDAQGCWPLHWAAWEGEQSDEDSESARAEAISLLAQHGHPVDARDEGGETPLHWAVAADGGSPSAVKALLAAGADPNLGDEEQVTPLHLAAELAELECARLLIEAGADPLAMDSGTDTPLEKARETLECLRSAEEIVRLLEAAENRKDQK